MTLNSVLISIGVIVISSVVIGFLRYRKKKKAEQDKKNKITPFLRAVLSGTIKQIVEEITKQGGTIGRNTPSDAAGHSAIMLAVKRGDISIVQAILARIPKEELLSELQKQNQEGYSAVHIAAIARQFEIMCLIHEKLGDINFKAERNKWTTLHIASAQGDLSITKWLISHGSNVNAVDVVSHSPLILASCNGHFEIVKLLLDSGADVKIQTSNSLETAIYMASRNGHENVVELLLTHHQPDCIDAAQLDNINGATPLHAACSSGSFKCVKLLIDHSGSNCDINALRRDAYTPLHIACIINDNKNNNNNTNTNNLDVISYLLSKGANPKLKTRFGTTALHEAAFHGNVSIVKLLVENGSDIKSVDKDGETPLHRACNAKKPSIDVMKLLILAGSDVNAKSSGDGTPLHLASCCHSDEAPERVKLLLESGSDISALNCHKWTALHLAYSVENPQVINVIEEFAKNHSPEFLKHFDKTQPRDLSEQGKPKQQQVDPETQQALLRTFGNEKITMESIAKKINSGSIKHVVVLMGAGVSVGAGIPDFRGPTSREFRAEREKLGISTPTTVFDLTKFLSDPKPFYAVIRETFLPVIRGQKKPTKFHWLLRLMHEKGVLERIYTQNVDTMEHVVGVPKEKIVEAHGTFRRAYCTGGRCGNAIESGSEQMNEFWNEVEKGNIPKCQKCGCDMIPDVVFFGMQLPRRFSETRTIDFKNCDLLIVAGTTLVVYPFASLVNDVSDLTPRLLFNSETVGPWKKSNQEHQQQKPEQEESTSLSSNVSSRDISFIGDCDEGAETFTKSLGWNEDLVKLISQSSPSSSQSSTN